MQITIDKNSNFTHKGGKPRFVVQAWSNLDGWQDTKHQSNDLPMALEMGRRLQHDRSRWMGDVRRVQIVDRTGEILNINLPEPTSSHV